jgi:hypothetical protein
LALLPLLLSCCANPFSGRTLAATPVAGVPTESDWASAVPLDLSVWKGNVHIRPELVALDSETSHKSTAACHHGTSNAPPVPVRLMALYSPKEIFLRIAWDDATPDPALGPEGGKSRDRGVFAGTDDGFAVMWGAPDEKDFRCQTSCHMVDVGLSGSATLMQMKMIAPTGKRYDLWRWRSAITAPYEHADDMVVETAGKHGDAGQQIPRENRRPDGTPAWTEPGEVSYLVEAPRGTEADVTAAGGWRDGRYSVVLRRRLATGDSGDIPFAKAESIPFSLAVFDHTFREHHVSSETYRLRLASPLKNKREVERDPMDF